MRTFAIINQKGGCGKTTTSINLAAALADSGSKTLLVDMDPQSHCALGLAVPESRIEQSIADILLDQSSAGGYLQGPPTRFQFTDEHVTDAQGLIWHVSQRLDLIPSTTQLAAVEHRLASMPDRDLRLAKALTMLAPRYDVCLIDCPPSIGLLTFNALRASREVIIPVEMGYFALHGAMKQAMTLQVLADRVRHEVGFYVLPTMHDDQTGLADQIVGELRRHFGQRVLDITIRYSLPLKEAASLGQPIGEYDPQCPAAQDYRDLAQYLMSITPAEARLAAPAAALAISGLQESDGGASIEAAPRGAPVGEIPMSGDRVADLLQRAKALQERKMALRT